MTASIRLPVAVLAALLAGVPGGCRAPDPSVGENASGPPGDSAGSLSVSLRDAEGRQVRLRRPALRVISLVPSATQTLAALGAAPLVVARTDHDTASWARALPSVGGGLYPSLEAIVAARPDVVIRFGGPQDTRTPSALDELGIPHLAIRPDRIASALEAIRLVGEATGTRPRADTLIQSIEAELEQVRAAAQGQPRIRVAYVLGGDPPWVAGPGTYIQELLEIAGGENVFADLGALYAAVSVEEFLAREIALILTPDAGRLDPRVAARARIAEVGDALEYPGPGVAAAARLLAALLHGSAGR